MPSLVRDEHELLRPYLPRLLIQWLSETNDAGYRQVEGSIVFVDISGFTRLSERLARRGKVGAEELTDAIGTCFTRLLGVAYGNGGGLVKFGGDALLLLFTGPDHQAKAARAAVGMRRELREIGTLNSPGGRVTLRMSVGVHSGFFHFFLVGDSHRELIITGPAATATVLMESTAEAGDIVVSAATAAALPPNVIGPQKGPGFLLRKEPLGIAPERSGVDGVPSVEQMLSCIPTATREHVLAALHEPEHKRVTIAFIHFDGTDEIIARGGPSACADALQVLVQNVQRAADRNRVCFLGTDVDRDGGKIILTAGAPTATGNDEERMLLTLREIVDGERAIPVRVGVNRGHVFAGEIGPFYRRTYTVMGDAVNLAARLMAKAQPGEILATEGVLQQSRAKFDTTSLEPFQVKGKSQPVQAVLVGSVTRAKDARDETTAPLVGRAHEMEVLLAALDAARGGQGRVVEIVGEPGIGKSRLVEELKAHAGDMTILSAVCELYQTSTPYSPLVGPLRRAFGIAETDDDAFAAERLRAIIAVAAPHLAPWVPLLGIPLSVHIPPTPEVAQLDNEFRRQRMEEIVVELLIALLRAPTLFVFEDTHWMDEASAVLLGKLSADMRGLPWLFCVTRRDVEEGFAPASAPDVDVLRPEPLDQAAAAALVDAITEETPLAQHEIATLAERSGGNPLFLKELLTAAREAGGIEGLPDSVEALITARIDRLPPRERTVLKRLSVLGPTFYGELARAVIPAELTPEDETAWQRLEEFIAPDGTEMFRFRHALIRDAAYEGLPYRLRRDLHALVGETIEGAAGEDADEQAEVLSLHYFYAHRYGPAWRYSRLAAERARSIYANIEAADFYERAIEAARREGSMPTPQVAGVYESLGDVRNRIGEFPKAVEAYRSARRLSNGDAVASARLMLKQASIRQVAGRFVEAVRLIRRAHRALEGAQGADAARQRAQLAVAQASVRRAQGRSQDAIKWCRRVIEDHADAGDKDALAHAYYLLDAAYVDLGMLEEAKHSALALVIYEELNDLRGQGVVLNNLGGRAYWRGNWNEALDLYDRGRVAREKIGDAVNATYGTANIGEILVDQGRLDEAETMLRQALRVWRAAGDHTSVAFAMGLLGRLAARCDRFEEALGLLHEARSEAEHVGAAADVIDIDSKIAECLVLQGDSALALSTAERALEEAKTVGGAGPLIAMLHRTKGWALMQLGDQEGARAAFEESLRVARSRNADYEVALTLRATDHLARAEGGPGADGAGEESQRILDRLGVIRVFEPSPSLKKSASQGLAGALG